MEAIRQADPERVRLMLAANECGVLPNLVDALVDYALQGYVPGAFLTALLENDLAAAVQYADHFSVRNFRELVVFLYTYAPGACWGSRAAVEQWRLRGGLLNRRAPAASDW